MSPRVPRRFDAGRVALSLLALALVTGEAWGQVQGQSRRLMPIAKDPESQQEQEHKREEARRRATERAKQRAKDWEAARARRPLAELPGPGGTDVAFSRDGKSILTAGGDEARLWDAGTFRPLGPALKQPGGKNLLLAALSPAGDMVVTVAGDEARVWDARTAETLSVLRHGARVRSASFNADGTRLVTGCDDGNASVWEPRTGRRVNSYAHGAPVVASVFSPDGKTVVSQVMGPNPGKRDFDGQVEAWDVTGGKRLWRRASDLWPAPEESKYFRRWESPLAFSPDGERLAVIHFRNVEVVDARTGDTVAWVDTMDVAGGALSVSFSEKASRLLAGTRGGAAAFDVTPAMEKRDPKRPVELPAAGKPAYFGRWVGHAEFSRDGERALLAIDDRFEAVAVIDVRSGEPILELPGYDTEMAAVSLDPTGRRVATGFASDDFTSIWEVPTREEP